MLILSSFPAGGLAVVLGASSGIGDALFRAVRQSGQFELTLGFSRSAKDFDLLDEGSIARLAADIGARNLPLRLVIVATGLLHNETAQPEKTWRNLDPAALATSFAVNASGPVLLAKHLLPLLPREGKAVFAALSAKVGSIGDNRLGGWYAYRAAKAALNQFMHTAAIELARNRPNAICVTLHPGTVATALSQPFAGTAHPAVSPDFAAQRLLAVIQSLTPAQTGLFLDHSGAPLPW